jgi:membrane protease YdiL (CAAX protease family)
MDQPAPVPSPEPARQHKLPWNPLLALIFIVLLYFIAPIIGGLLVSVYPALQGWDLQRTNEWLQQSVYAQFSYVLIAEVITVGALLFFLARYKRKLKDIGLTRPKWMHLGTGILAYPAYFLVFVIMVTLVHALVPGFNIDQEQELGFDTVRGALPLIVTFISLVILPPIVEELTVRGFLFTSLRDRLKYLPAMLITSFVFAAAHLPQGGAAGPLYIAALDTFILSVVLCWLREKTGSLWPGITLHAIKNCVAYVSLFIIPLL